MLRLAILRVLGARGGDWQFAIPMGSSLGFEVSGEQALAVSDLDLTPARSPQGCSAHAAAR